VDFSLLSSSRSTLEDPDDMQLHWNITVVSRKFWQKILLVRRKLFYGMFACHSCWSYLKFISRDAIHSSVHPTFIRIKIFPFFHILLSFTPPTFLPITVLRAYLIAKLKFICPFRSSNLSENFRVAFICLIYSEKSDL
jgi:hypothetical protein